MSFGCSVIFHGHDGRIYRAPDSADRCRWFMSANPVDKICWQCYNKLHLREVAFIWHSEYDCYFFKQ
jgi:hypothetical protein